VSDKSHEIRAICPQCESITLTGRVDPKFYYNPEKGVGYCHHCGFKGRMEEDHVDNLNVVSIRERIPFNPSVFDTLLPLPPEAERYLSKRFPGANLQEISDSFKLRYSPQYHAIAIPTLNEAGEPQGIKYRFIAPLGDQRYIAEEASQFGGYWTKGKVDKLLIVEGEFDAITAKLLGFEGTVLALQTNKLSQDSIQRVRSFKNVFLNLDNDKAGAEGTTLIKSILGMTQPSYVTLEDAKDLNELIQKVGHDESSRFLKEATRTELEKATRSLVDSIPEMLGFLSDDKNTRGTSTGFHSLDILLGGGLRAAEATVVNAFAKTGKTSFINNVVHNLAQDGKKVAIASFEMDPARTLYPSLLSIAARVNVRQIAKEDLRESLQYLSTEFSYLSNIVTLKRFGTTLWNEVEEWATLMKEQHNIEFLVLDHAGFMVEKMTDAEENQILAKNIKKLTNTLGVHILVVVQAPKTKDGLSIQTSYGGLAWGMNSDNFIILERDKTDDTLLKVRLEAARYPGAMPGNQAIHLFYNRDNCSLSED
jgi:5S rRNA maturation endonuclease (ribonuclease M5)/archaellum biogenesis ATPase FlaH